MSEKPQDTDFICLSTNGKTQSSSKAPPTRLLVATIDGISLFTRADAKSPWSLKERFLEGDHVSSLLYEPKSGAIVAGLHYVGGIKVSEDGGKTWSSRKAGLTSEHVYSLAAQYVGDKTILFAGTEPARVHRSEDLGRTWRALAPLNTVPDVDKWLFPHAEPHAKNIAFHPSEPDTLYVCVEQGDVLKTVDGGKSWFQVDSYEQPGDKFRRDVHRIVIFPSNPKEMYLTGGDGLYHSNDAGETWEHLTGPTFRLGYPDPVFIHPDNENTAFMVGAGLSPNPSWGASGSANPAFVRTTDRGRNWSERMGGLPTPVRGNLEAAAMHQSEAGLEFFMGSACGELYTSSDEGGSWTLISKSLPAVSKGSHFRHFLPPEERAEVEKKLRALNAYA